MSYYSNNRETDMSYYSNNRETDRSCSHGGSNRIVVGITSRSSEQDLQWLMDFIRSTFRDHVSYVKYLPVSNSNRVDWERNVRTCSVVILYHTKRQGRINITDVDGGLYDEELQILSTTPGRSKVLVVLDDLENCSDAEKQRILVTQPSLQRFSSELFLFPEEGKYEEAMKKKGEFIKLLGIKAAARDPQPNTAKAKDTSSSFLPNIFSRFSRDKISKALSIDFTSKQPQPRLKISIFSRSAESNYGWLTEWLKTTYMTRPVDVRAVYISNTASPFYTELSHCSFAILYHTKKQGRINITDVTDNLYDEELRDLSTNLGKENVIVVIDDLQNDNSSEKERILRSQPSIGRLARGLFLFNEKKKNSENLEEINQILKKKIPRSEVPGDDYRRDTAARNYNDSSMAAKYPGRAHSQDSSVDKEPTPSWSQPPESRRNPDNVTAHNTSRKRAEDSGPEAKRRNLLPIGPTPQSSQAIAEVENAIRKANACFILSSEANSAVYQKWLEYQQIQEEESRDMARKIQRLQRENEELQSRNSDLVMKMTENEDNQKQLLESIEKLHKDLCDKDKIIEESRCKMEDKINELKKELREKEELGIQIRNQAERAIEKLHQDRHKYQKIIEENEDTIRKMEAKIQQLQNDNHARETNPRQKQAGHGAQRYNVRSPIPGEEAEETSSNQDMKKCEWKEEGSPRARTQQNTEMSNPRQKPAETQSPREAEEQIEELRRRVQQKDEEIQKMKTLLQIHETVINDLLEASDGGKKPKS